MTTVSQFTESLATSGLLGEADLRTVREARPPRADTTDALDFARRLVREGLLTRYQAAAVYQGKVKGLILGDYIIQEKLGAGGMGLVFKAQHRRMKRTVALKLIAPSVTKSAAAAERFQREVEAAAKLVHPHIVTAYDAGEANRVHYLVMEYVDGQNLSQIVKGHGPLSVRRAVNYIIQAARGLQHAHTQGVVHRDIKPANLLLDLQDVVKVLDMGLARFYHELPPSESSDEIAIVESELTQVGAIHGTLDFMAPEQARDTRNADQRADVYSLGCTLYYILTVQPLFPRDTPQEKIRAHRDEAVPSLRELRPDVPVELGAIFRRMVTKNPDDRFQSMQELISALEKCDLSQAPAHPPIVGTTGAVQVPDDSELLRFLQVVGDEAGREPALDREEIVSPRRFQRPPRPDSKSSIPKYAPPNRRFVHYAITAFLLVLLLAAVGYLAVPHAQGTLQLDLEHPDAVVFIDGNRLPHAAGGPRTVRLRPGRHLLTVTRAGSHAYVEEFTLDRRTPTVIRVHLPLIAGPGAADLKSWPGALPGLEFAWDHADRPLEWPDPATRQKVTNPIVAHGLARYGRHFEQDLRGGSFVLEGGAPVATPSRLLPACRKSGQFTLEALITTDSTHAKGAARIISFAPDGPDGNFALFQEKDRLYFRLRTSKPGDGPPPTVELCRILPERPLHVIVTYADGLLVCYADGVAATSSILFQGDLSAWTEQPLVCGRVGESAPAWHGRLEAVAFHSRSVGHEEASRRADLVRTRLASRRKTTPARLRAKLVQPARLPTPGEIQPSDRLLVVQTYEARFGNSGPAQLIRVAHWGVLNGVLCPLPAREAGQTCPLELERFADQPQLAKERLLDNADHADAPLYYDVGT